jgi:hypothetical protein
MFGDVGGYGVRLHCGTAYPLGDYNFSSRFATTASYYHHHHRPTDRSDVNVSLCMPEKHTKQ